MSRLRLLIAGCAGRMGRALIAEILRRDDIVLAGGFERPGHALLGADLATLAGAEKKTGLKVAAEAGDLISETDVLIDFTTPAAALAAARLAAGAGRAIVIGATGFDAAGERAIADLAAEVPIVKSGNMSLGVNLLAALVRQAASRLGVDYDIEIAEAHHRRKVDAPSGTALMLGRAAAEGRGVLLDAKAAGATTGRAGLRREGDIGFAVSRGGGVVGDHAVTFVAEDEAVVLSHRAFDRALFARGAVAAAIWASARAPGLYDMEDVLGLNGPRPARGGGA